jgi:hypothetical protein
VPAHPHPSSPQTQEIPMTLSGDPLAARDPDTEDFRQILSLISPILVKISQFWVNVYLFL